MVSNCNNDRVSRLKCSFFTLFEFLMFDSEYYSLHCTFIISQGGNRNLRDRYTQTGTDKTRSMYMAKYCEKRKCAFE